MQEILASQEAFQQNTEKVLQDLANIAKTSNEEDVANKATKSDMEECMKCVEKLQNDAKEIYKIIATYQKEPKKPHNRKNWKRHCWTCGSGNHSSKHCAQRADGHKEEATHNKRMKGRNKNCD